MANTILTPTILAKDSLRLLHNTVVMAGKVNRQYDESFGSAGASVSGKIGPSLRVRKAVQMTVSEGSNLQVQDILEEYKTITVSNRDQVSFKFPMQDLTLSIDMYRDRYLKPAMAAMAAKIDRRVMGLYKDVYQTVGTPGTPCGSGMTAAQTTQVYLDAGAMLSEQTTPESPRYSVISPAVQAATVGALSGLFNASSKISDQYATGVMGSAVLGYDWYVSSQTPAHTNSTGTAQAGVKVKGASQSGASLLCDATTGTIFKAGDTFTIASINAVNPESFESTGRAAQFVITADATATSSEVTLSISPSIYAANTSSVRQTVTALPADDAALTFDDTTASQTRGQGLLFHPDAFTLVTTNLELPGTDWEARETYDGISMRILKQYDINSDTQPCRIDILSGVLTLDSRFAVRLWS